jgi:hypothetical protein
MKTLTPIRPQPLPKLSLIFNANRRSLLREPVSLLAPWKKLNVRGRT